MTPAAFRRLCLALPETSEGSHQDHPDFRAHGRIFATLQPDGARAMVKLPPDEQQRLLRQHGEVFEPANGAWGRQGCTLVQLDRVEPAVLRAALTLAWQASLKPTARAGKAVAKGPAGPRRRG